MGTSKHIGEHNVGDRCSVSGLKNAYGWLGLLFACFVVLFLDQGILCNA